MNIRIFPALICALLLVFQSCNVSDQETEPIKGTVNFSFSKYDKSEITSRISENENIDAILISIVDNSGNTINDRTKIQLYEFNGEYLSEPVSFSPGEYWVSEYIILDSANKAIYAAPLKGSNLAELVSQPLPLSFQVLENSVSKTSIEVLSTSLGNSQAFGYSTFSLDVVETLALKLSVFSYNEDEENFDFTTATLEVFANDTLIRTLNIEDSVSTIIVNGGYESYTLALSKEGYTNKFKVVLSSEFEDYLTKPLTIILFEGEISEVVVQPNGENGKDALIYSYDPDKNYEAHPQINGFAWTNNGDIATARSLVEFDLSNIPQNAEVEGVYLSLYHHIASNNTGHSQLSGSNEGLLQKVTEAWEEDTVTWNNQPEISEINQVTLSASTSDTQNYLDIDVTGLFISEDGEWLTNYGMMLSQVTEEHFRSLTFASSDIVDSSKHPKLVVKFK